MSDSWNMCTSIYQTLRLYISISDATHMLVSVGLTQGLFQCKTFQTVQTSLKLFMTFFSAYLPNKSISTNHIRGTVQHFITRWYSCGEDLLAPRPNPKWRTTPYLLSATVYSTHWQLPSISGGGILHPPPHDAPCRDSASCQSVSQPASQTYYT
jgi:hypothetical protein